MAVQIIEGVEIYAIMWASKEVVQMNWNYLEWASDTTTVVQDIMSEDDPEGLNSRYDLLKIKASFVCFNWKISWHVRSSNMLANRIAKFYAC